MAAETITKPIEASTTSSPSTIVRIRAICGTTDHQMTRTHHAAQQPSAQGDRHHEQERGIDQARDHRDGEE